MIAALLVAVAVAAAVFLVVSRQASGINRPPLFSTSWRPGIMELFKNPPKFLSDAQTKVGGVWSIGFGLSRRWIFITDRKLFKANFAAMEDTLSLNGAIPVFFSHLLRPEVFLSPKYQFWLDTYKKFVTTGFWRANQLDVFEEGLTNMVERVMQQWESRFAATGKEFDLWAEVAQLTALMNLRIVFGEAAADQYGEEWKLAFPELDRLSINQLVAAYSSTGSLPFLRVGPIKRFFELKTRVFAMTEEMFDSILVTVKEKLAEVDEAKTPTVDCYAELLAAIESEKYEKWLLVEHVLAMAFAAHLNTANTLSWGVAKIAQDKAIQERIRSDADNGTKADAAFSQHVAREATRLYPTMTMSIRMSVGDQQIPGTDFFARAGDVVSVAGYNCQRDPEFFPDPDAFKPERFEDPVAMKNFAATLAYSGFGSGVHRCLGEKLVLRLARAVFQAVFSRFEVELVNKELPEPIWVGSSNPSPASPVFVKLKMRS